MADRGRTIWEQAAIRWAEHVVETRGDATALPGLLAAVKAGIADEGALETALAAAGATVERAYEVLDATLYRDGKRVRGRTNPCQQSWDPDRPCVLEADHGDVCSLSDVPPRMQREVDAQFAAEYGAVVAAFGGAR